MSSPEWNKARDFRVLGTQVVLDGVLTRDGFVQKPGGVGEYCMPRIPIKNNSEPAVDQVVTIV
jgi:hypothetical protein